MTSDLLRRTLAEAIGTAMLLAAVVGSGVMGERLSGGNVFQTLLANALATGCALIALILTFVRFRGRTLIRLCRCLPRCRRLYPGERSPVMCSRRL